MQPFTFSFFLSLSCHRCAHVRKKLFHFRDKNTPCKVYSIHVIFIQFYIPCSTICSIFNFYSMFNASVPLNSSFNIQLFIQCSTFYSTFNDLFNVQLFIQHSKIYSTFNFFSNIQLLIQYSTF